MGPAEETVIAAKQGFEAAFAEMRFYNRQTQDASHLHSILACLPVMPGMRILDLGTGSGYLAFALAEEHPDIPVTGLDIVEQTLAENRSRAARANLNNLHFVSYGGMELPFANHAFDLIVSRYAMHHFPEIGKSLSEVSRVLSEDGWFFVSDPTPNTIDRSGFIDAYMRVKPDGHIRFYTQAEWTDMCGSLGFSLVRSFMSRIRFPRRAEPAYQAIIKQHDPAVPASYDLQITADEIYVTEQVNNLLFRKTAARL